MESIRLCNLSPVFSENSKMASKRRSCIVCWTSRDSPDDCSHENLLIAIVDAMVQAAEFVLSKLFWRAVLVTSWPASAITENFCVQSSDNLSLECIMSPKGWSPNNSGVPVGLQSWVSDFLRNEVYDQTDPVSLRLCLFVWKLVVLVFPPHWQLPPQENLVGMRVKMFRPLRGMKFCYGGQGQRLCAKEPWPSPWWFH